MFVNIVNISPIITTATKLEIKYLSDSSLFPIPSSIEINIPPPSPNIRPIPLYTAKKGRKIFSAEIPSAPTP